MRVLLTGAGGMLGRAFQAGCPSGWCIDPRPRTALDVCDPHSVRTALVNARPEVIINCAAFTDVDGAESAPEAAERANALGPQVLAAEASAAGVLLVHISTDFVFDGRAEEPYPEGASPLPVSVYGSSKLAGEEAIRSSGAEHLIVRTSWLYGDDGPSFPATMLRLAARGSLRVVDDQTGSPTYAPHLVAGVARALAKNARGTLHLAGHGSATRFDFARALFLETGVAVEMARARTEDFPSAARRPAYSVLGSSHPCAVQLPPWRQGLEAYARQLEDGSRSSSR